MSVWNGSLARSMLRGLWLTVVRPRRALEAAPWPARLPSERAWLFAALAMAPLVVCWGPVRNFGGGIALLFKWPLRDALKFAFGSNVLGSPSWWFRLMKWELWSVSRWWLLFGALAVVLAWRRKQEGPRSSLNTAVHRLLLFAPWIALLELGYLIGVWVARGPEIIPEPSTVFANRLNWDAWLRATWLVRGVVPTVVVGLVFFRAVTRWRWPASVVGAVVLVPVAINLSVLWSVVFVRWVLQFV